MAHFYIEDLSQYPINPTKEELQQIDNDFCNKLKQHFFQENKSLQLSDQESMSQLSEFQTAMSLGQTGSPKLLLSQLQSIPANQSYWTQQRKDFYTSELTEYIALTNQWR